MNIVHPLAGACCLAVAARAAYLLATEPFDLAVVGRLFGTLALTILFGHWLWEEIRPRRSSEPEPASIGCQTYRESEDRDV